MQKGNTDSDQILFKCDFYCCIEVCKSFTYWLQNLGEHLWLVSLILYRDNDLSLNFLLILGIISSLAILTVGLGGSASMRVLLLLGF